MILRILLALMFSLLVYLTYQLVWGEQGMQRQEELAKQIQYQESINGQLRQRNEALRAQVRDLRQGEDAVEEHIRTELQYIKEGEVFYRMVEK
ncbi:septum formation inhibitor [Maribrevibacterium harenarium]|uniref:Cell division protein FtsB n=1 Tax=Maribrevibacterium harenarium TaxID=2589817 RepID=A0A501WWJ8_9GAMM|nr:septum formation initiator family protein [Maribrevibacterium harenarium]TPE52810.1 septum formation inhibitor [Maribrevibacterium harenarium]